MSPEEKLLKGDFKVLHVKGHPELEGMNADELDLEELSCEILEAKLANNPPPWEEFEGQDTWLGQVMYDTNQWLLTKIWWYGPSHWLIKSYDEHKALDPENHVINWRAEYQRCWLCKAWDWLFDPRDGLFTDRRKAHALYANYCWPPGE